MWLYCIYPAKIGCAYIIYIMQEQQLNSKTKKYIEMHAKYYI